MGKSKYFQLVLSLFILTLLYLNITGDVLINLRNISFKDLAICICIMLGSTAPRIIRWRSLMNQGDGENISILLSSKLTFVGLALNLVTPASMGDILKSYYGYKWTGLKERMISVSIFDKIMAFFSLGLLSFLAFCITRNGHYMISSLFCVLPFIVVKSEWLRNVFIKNTVLYSLNKRTIRLNLESLFNNLKFSNEVIISSIFFSVLAWLIDFYLLYNCFRLLNLKTPLTSVIFDGVVLKIGKLFPFTLSGMGTDEVLTVYLFSNSETENGVILAASLFYRFIMMILPALIGAVIMLLDTTNKRMRLK